MLSPSKQQGDQYENPFASSGHLASEYQSASDYVEPDIDLTGQSTSRQGKPTPPSQPAAHHTNHNDNPFALSGSIGSAPRSIPAPSNAAFQYTGQDTLDEPVSTTILRDLKQVARKLQQVLHPKGDRSVLQDWDLWGPLILCLSLAITLSSTAPSDQAVSIFTGVFVIVWLGAAVVTLNAKLLGGTVSFFQSVCVIGYCLFPLVVASIVAIFVELIWVRLPLSIVSFLWATYASVGFLSESEVHLRNRRALAVYPLCLFYLVISWLVLIS